MNNIYAAVDLGTNACRLLVAKLGGESSFYQVIESFSYPVALAQKMMPSYSVPLISGQAMQRSVTALSMCAEKMKAHEVSHMRCVATQACRQAKNTWKMLDSVREACQLNVEVISPEEEAWLAISGCVDMLDFQKEYVLLFDIGGGSTELILCKLDAQHQTFHAVDYVSLPYGVVSLKHHCAEGKETFHIKRIRRILNAFVQKNDIAAHVRRRSLQFLGASGTVTTLAAIIDNLVYYDRHMVHGRVLRRKDVLRVVNSLVDLSYEDMLTVPCIGKRRAYFMIPGIKIFTEIFRFIPASHVCVADRGVREGVLFHLMGIEALRLATCAFGRQLEYAKVS